MRGPRRGPRKAPHLALHQASGRRPVGKRQRDLSRGQASDNFIVHIQINSITFLSANRADRNKIILIHRIKPVIRDKCLHSTSGNAERPRSSGAFQIFNFASLHYIRFSSQCNLVRNCCFLVNDCFLLSFKSVLPEYGFQIHLMLFDAA